MRTDTPIVVALAFLTLGLGAIAHEKTAAAVKKSISSTEAVDVFFAAVNRIEAAAK